MQRLWIVMAASLAACVGEEQVSVTVEAQTDCEIHLCGGNSPLMDTHPAREFAIDGTPNEGHLSLATIEGQAQIWSSAGINYNLVLQDGRFVGRRPGFPDLAGNALEMSYMLVLLDGKPKYYLVIEYARFPTTFIIGTHDTFEAYKFTWSFVDDGGPSPDKLLCSQPPKDERSPDKSTELLGIYAVEAVMFVGDRIDGKHRTFVGYDKRWFNIGCAGNVLAKTFLTRSTTQSKDGLRAPWWGPAQFQATLKMYSADYCGTGKAFTIAGQHIVWQDDAGLVTYWAPPTEYESRWTANGATCLDRPRRIAADPDIREAIDKECRDNGLPVLQPCWGDGTFTDLGNAARITAFSPLNP